MGKFNWFVAEACSAVAWNSFRRYSDGAWFDIALVRSVDNPVKP